MSDATTPLRAAEVAVSPLRLLEFQAHALAVGAWAGGGLTGSELDDLLPVQDEGGGLPPISAVLAGYVAAADSPGAATSRALLSGEDLREPTSIQFPSLVLVLFASDVATDGGRVSAGSVINLAVADSAPGADRAIAAISGTLCSDAARFIDNAIHDLFALLKVATPGNAVGRVIVSIWNWIVDQGERFVRTLIHTVTDAVLGTIRAIAGAIAAVAEQAASLLPYSVQVRTQESTTQGASDSTTFFLLPASQLGGQFVATVTAGDLPNWPDLLADCAKTAQVALPSFRGRGLPVIWGSIRGAASAFIGGISADQATNEQGQANWTFQTSIDPGSPNAEQLNAVGQMPVTVHRPEIEAARNRLTALLLAPVPELLRGFVGRLFAPYLDALQGRLNGLLDARGLGFVIVVYHGGTRPSAARATASPSATRAPASGGASRVPNACGLLSDADASAVLGQPAHGAENPLAITDRTTQSNCFYGISGGGAGFALYATSPGSLDAIIKQRAVTLIPGIGDRAYSWDLASLRYAAAQVGDVVLMVVLSTKSSPAAAATLLLKIAVSHL